VAEEIRRLLHQFAAGFLKPVQPELLTELSAHEHDEAALAERLAEPVPPAMTLDEPEAAEEVADEPEGPVTSFASLNPLGEVRFSALEDAPVAAPGAGGGARAGAVTLLGEQIEAADAIDPSCSASSSKRAPSCCRSWPTAAPVGGPTRPDGPAWRPCGPCTPSRAVPAWPARCAWARWPTGWRPRSSGRPPRSGGAGHPGPLHQGVDQLAEEFARCAAAMPRRWRRAAGTAAVPEPRPSSRRWWTGRSAGGHRADAAAAARAAAATTRQAETVAPTVRVDWPASGPGPSGRTIARWTGAEPMAAGSVRVRAPLLDRMVSHAGEVGIARARMEADVGQMQGSLRELTDNLERLRRQLRDLELQAETQMASRIEAARSAQQSFDPLEMDRFTRVQELTRMMAESVSDVGTVQRSLLQTLQDAEDQLAMQARLARDLQDDLLRPGWWSSTPCRTASTGWCARPPRRPASRCAEPVGRRHRNGPRGAGPHRAAAGTPAAQRRGARHRAGRPARGASRPWAASTWWCARAATRCSWTCATTARA
jgi:chemosensory pili system protein ChpA (sensor histidine kinase/response regulator)